MIDGALVNGGAAECLVADRFGALAGVGSISVLPPLKKAGIANRAARLRNAHPLSST